MSTNQTLQSARDTKNDEFYTRTNDISKELKNYSHHLVGKSIYCNCDDWEKSNFVKYFKDNFANLGLKKIVATCYMANGNGKRFEYDGDNVTTANLNGDGDFRSEECLAELAKCDVVVTNPPFSLIRNFLETIAKHDKKLLIVSNLATPTLKDPFQYFKRDELWFGMSKPQVFTNESGEMIKFGMCCWITNLDHPKRNKLLELKETYHGNESNFQKYDNCEAIHIKRVKGIPADYPGLMGVPTSFFEHYNREQFEIVRLRYGDDGKGLELDGKQVFVRILVRNRNPV